MMNKGKVKEVMCTECGFWLPVTGNYSCVRMDGSQYWLPIRGYCRICDSAKGSTTTRYVNPEE